MSVITCPSCNTPAPPGAVFCDHCGYDLRTVTPTATGQPMPPTFMVSSADTGAVICPVCQHGNIAGSAFCENCGAQLSQKQAAPVTPPPAPASPPRPEPMPEPAPVFRPAAPQPPAGITGRLVIVESQVTLPIPPGKSAIVIGREDPVSGVFPDIDLDPHGGHEAGVGRRHARIVLDSGKVFLEDLDSVNGTALNRQRIPANEPRPMNTGDEIRLGKMALIYYAG
jgi:hypothetical protein